MENKAQDKKEDKLILGGHEFNSRAVLKLSHLLLDVPIQRIKRIFLISYRRE